MSKRLSQAKNHIHNKEFIQALEIGRSLVRQGQELADAHTIVGIAAGSMGDQTLAQSSFIKAANLSPGSHTAWANLGRFGFNNKNYTLMQDAYGKAWKLQPFDAELGCNFADALVKQEKLADALATIKEVLAVAPGHPRAEALNVTLQSDLLPMKEWGKLWNNLPIQHWPLEWKCLVAELQTIWSWAHDGENFLVYLSQLRQQVLQAEGTGFALMENIQNAKAYLNMFAKLAESGMPPAPDASLPRLYMLGDSHSMPPQNQIVAWQGKSHQISSQLVMGIKLWDLINPNYTGVRDILLYHLEKLPADATVIISVGEIDARPNFGIYKNARTRSKPWQPIIESTVAPAMAWLKQQQKGRTFILPGIPAPISKIKHDLLPPDRRADYVACTTAINEALKTEAARQGFPLIDLFAYTTENPTAFAEGVHLIPTALPQALSTHLIA